MRFLSRTGLALSAVDRLILVVLWDVISLARNSMQETVDGRLELCIHAQCPHVCQNLL